MANKMNSYTIMAKLELECDIEIKAESLLDALEKSEKLTANDFIEFNGQFLDGSLHIKGMIES